MTTLEDVRKTIEATIGTFTPAKAQRLAKRLSEPGAAKEQVAKTAQDLLDWSQRSRGRLRELVRREIADQLKGMGLASQSEVDALKRRVRDVERAAGLTASGRKRSAATRTKTSGRKRTTASPTRGGASGSS